MISWVESMTKEGMSLETGVRECWKQDFQDGGKSKSG